MKSRSGIAARFSPSFSLLLASLVAAVGTAWAFQRGAPDFSVFWHAWSSVWTGKGAEIYRGGPDLYLYAPGFAWLLAPLASMDREFVLALWCLAKTACLGLVVRAVARESGAGLTAALGVVLLARPLLIDFQYGQVNVFVMTAALLPLLAPSPLGWFALGVAAASKLIIAPLLAVPWLVPQEKGHKRWLARAASVCGVALVFLLPAMSVGQAGLLALHREWLGALQFKGVPLDSHNQGFMAVIAHLVGTDPTHVIGLGADPVALGWQTLSMETVRLIGAGWTCFSGGLILAWMFFGQEGRSRLAWASVLVAALPLASHLVWKPYFVFALPLACLWSVRLRGWGDRATWVGLCLLIGFTTSTFVGPLWAAKFEAYGALLWTWIALLLWGFRPFTFSIDARRIRPETLG